MSTLKLCKYKFVLKNHKNIYTVDYFNIGRVLKFLICVMQLHTLNLIIHHYVIHKCLKIIIKGSFYSFWLPIAFNIHNNHIENVYVLWSIQAKIKYIIFKGPPYFISFNRKITTLGSPCIPIHFNKISMMLTLLCFSGKQRHETKNANIYLQQIWKSRI